MTPIFQRLARIQLPPGSDTRLRMLMLFTGWSRQPLDEPTRDIGFDHHPAVGRDVTQDPGDAVQPRNLLPIEFLGAVERNRDPAGIQRQP